MTTKRTPGQCSDECQRWRLGIGSVAVHLAVCPALYPLQRQPGDEKDALTRLATLLHTTTEQVEGMDYGQLTDALDLISEAREEQKRTRDSADVDFSGLSRAISRSEPLPTCNSAGGIVIAAELHRLHVEFNKATSDLRLCQSKMGEARKQALAEGRSAGHDEAVSWCREQGLQKSTVGDLEDALLALYRS